jgi:hypothetical protein
MTGAVLRATESIARRAARAAQYENGPWRARSVLNGNKISVRRLIQFGRERRHPPFHHEMTHHKGAGGSIWKVSLGWNMMTYLY